MNKKNLYKGAAQYYERYRTKYPDSLFTKIEQLFRLDGNGRLLDLGCGPGTIAIPISGKFDEVVAIDADPEMVEICQHQAQLGGIENITCLQKRSEDIDASWGNFKLVTIARAFHWMDRAAVLQTSHSLLVDGGGLVIISTDEDPRRGTYAWERATISVVKKWLGSAYPKKDLSHPQVPHEDIFADSPFSNYTTKTIQFEQTWSIPSYIGYLYSTSFCLRDFFAGNAKAFEEDLSEKLLAINPTGELKQTVNISLIVASKTKQTLSV